jgi:hypothetical protein
VHLKTYTYHEKKQTKTWGMNKLLEVLDVSITLTIVMVL